jgi:hypothetical protein
MRGMGFFRWDPASTKWRSGLFPPLDIKPFGGKGFHFEAGYDCHCFVIRLSLGFCADVMNDKNVPDGMTWEKRV